MQVERTVLKAPDGTGPLMPEHLGRTEAPMETTSIGGVKGEGVAVGFPCDIGYLTKTMTPALEKRGISPNQMIEFFVASKLRYMFSASIRKNDPKVDLDETCSLTFSGPNAETMFDSLARAIKNAHPALTPEKKAVSRKSASAIKAEGKAEAIAEMAAKLKAAGWSDKRIAEYQAIMANVG